MIPMFYVVVSKLFGRIKPHARTASQARTAADVPADVDKDG
jgi:hypothetical protein